MNAAAKVISQDSVFHGHLGKMRVSKFFYFQSSMLIAILVSALSVIYTTNLTRLTCHQLEVKEQEWHQLQLQRGQLLLEQASLSTPARIEALATDKLHMRLPVNKQVLRAQ